VSWLRFLRRRYWDDERARELQHYLDQETDDNLARGMSASDARRAACRKLGNPTRIREDIYDMNTLRLESVWHDLRYGARLLWRNPLFACVAVLTLALGTGANTAIFQLVNALRLQALPVTNAHELVEIDVATRGNSRMGRFTGRRPRLTYSQYERISQDQQVLSGLAVWGNTTFDLAEGGESRPVQGLWVNGDFFATLGVQARRGRVFTAADDVRGCASPGVVLSSAFWQREYAGSTGAIGSVLRLDGHPYEIIGVTPEGFFGVDVGRGFDVAVPLCAEAISGGAQSALDQPDHWFLGMIGRLKPGVSVAQADAHFGALSRGVFEATVPPRYRPADARIYRAFSLVARSAETGVSSLRGAYQAPLWILLGVTGLVLLITCANLANLLLARATAREREVAIRLAIGAARRRIVRQMLSECLLIAALGTAAGMLLAGWLSRALLSYLSTESNQVFVDLTPDWRVFAFTTALAVLACLLFGLTPALRATATDPGTTIKSTGRTVTDSGARFSVRSALVVVQVALSVVLVVGALLFGRSLHKLATMDPGFRQDDLLVANIDLRRAGIAPDALNAFCERIVDRLAAVGGVASASQAVILPVSGAGWNDRIVIGGATQQTLVSFNSVGARYFLTMGIQMVAGRDFGRTDTLQTPNVAIVNELFVRTFLSGRSPLGARFEVEAGPGEVPQAYEVVGVVEDTKYSSLRGPVPPQAYLAASQERAPQPFLQAVVHTNITPASVTPEITRVIQAIDPSILIQYSTMEQTFASALRTERLMATLSGFFGMLAGLIATLGLYGVISYSVARRRNEIGIRMALGAESGTVVRMIVREGAVLLAAGLCAGAALSVLAARFASTLLFELQPWDPTTLASATLALGLVATIASWIPARRAARLEPTAALRAE
jgi:predicted permease